LAQPADPLAWPTIADFVAPMFIFAIGLTFGLSYRKHKRLHGAKSAVGRTLTRYFALLGIGALITALHTAVNDFPSRWGVFEAIGVAGILLLIVIELPAYAKLAVATVFLTISQLFMTYTEAGTVALINHGGVVGTLAWGAMLIYSNCFADLFFKSKKRCWVLLLIFAVATAVSCRWIVPTKLTVSVSFVFFSVTVTAAGFLLTDFVCNLLARRKARSETNTAAEAEAKTKIPFDPLTWWGKNPLLLFLLGGIIIDFFIGILLPDFFWKEAPLWLAIPETLAIAALFTLIAWYLDKKKFFIKI